MRIVLRINWYEFAQQIIPPFGGLFFYRNNIRRDEHCNAAQGPQDSKERPHRREFENERCQQRRQDIRERIRIAEKADRTRIVMVYPLEEITFCHYLYNACSNTCYEQDQGQRPKCHTWRAHDQERCNAHNK